MHMQRNWGSGVLCSLIFALLLSGCSGGGGGEGDNTPAAAITGTAEGFWTGKTGDGRTVMGAVLDDDTYWFWYWQVGRPIFLGGAVSGQGHSQQGAFTSSDGFDFNVDNSSFGTRDHIVVNGTYLPEQSLSGIVTYAAGGTSTFNMTFSAPFTGKPVDLTQVAGTYTDGLAMPVPSLLTISPSGSVTLTNPREMFPCCTFLIGCVLTGTLSPRTQGVLADVTLTDTGCPNAFSPLTFTGIAVVNGDNAYLMAFTANRQMALYYQGPHKL